MDHAKQAVLEAAAAHMRALWLAAGGDADWAVLYADDCEIADQLRELHEDQHSLQAPVIRPARVESIAATLDLLKLTHIAMEIRGGVPDGHFRIVVCIGDGVMTSALPVSFGAN